MLKKQEVLNNTFNNYNTKMKQVEKIWAELSAKAQEVETPQESTELSEEVKIELGLVEDFTKIYESAVDADYNASGIIIDAFIKAEKKYKDIISDFERAAKIGSEAESAAKELGVDLPNVFQNKVETARRSIKEAQGMLSKISSWASQL